MRCPTVRRDRFLALFGACLCAVAAAATARAGVSNDTCASAQSIVANLSHPGTNFTATSDMASTPCSSRDNIDVWYRFTATVSGVHAIAASSPNWLLDTTLSVFTDCGGTMLACNDDATPFNGTDSLVAVSLSVGQSITIRVAGYDEGEGPFSIIVAAPPVQATAGACCTGAVCVTAEPAACVGDNVRFAGAGLACNSPGDASVPCCRADFTNTDGITINDIFEFLNAWFAGTPGADYNGGGLTVQDIFDFLNAWFAGC